MTFREILEREEQTMGQPCKKLAQHNLDGHVRVVLYECRGDTRLGGQVLVQQRLVAYHDNRNLFSAIAESYWEKA